MVIKCVVVVLSLKKALVGVVVAPLLSVSAEVYSVDSYSVSSLVSCQVGDVLV